MDKHKWSLLGCQRLCAASCHESPDQLVRPSLLSFSSNNLALTVIGVNRPSGSYICVESRNISLLVANGDDVSEGNSLGTNPSVSSSVFQRRPSRLTHVLESLVWSLSVLAQSF